MAERPDLDDIGRKLVDIEDMGISQIGAFAEDLLLLLRYCRELEAENKRLRDDSDEYHHARYLAND